MQHQIVSRDEWLAARTELLRREKEFTRLRDELSAERRALPWVKIETNYVFDGPNGTQTLADLFDGRSQLVVKHFMFGPDWSEGCVGCSFEVDQVQGALMHLRHHDVAYAAVSRAPIEKIEAFRRRMGWPINWVSSNGNDFNYDFNVSFMPEQIASGQAFYNYRQGASVIDEMSGRSVFYRDEGGQIFHTYSSFARGGEMFLGSYAFLDIAPKGRNETINGNLTDWVRHHDRYEDSTSSCCHD
jgi:predicted dithiol-disulfide oxidoreductase (DUF899 family)